MAKSGTTFLALLTGAAIGAGFGLLYAPDKGENTRKKLNEEAQKQRVKLDKQLKETTEHLSDSAKKAKTSFDTKLAETLSSASYKADDILNAMEKRLEELKSKNARLHKESKEDEIAEKTRMDNPVA